MSQKCILLNDSTVKSLLDNLTKSDILSFLDTLNSALEGFSVHNERAKQPKPAVVRRDDGRKNLFRCFSSSTGTGVKIIVDPAKANDIPTDIDTAEATRLKSLHGLLALTDPNGFPTGFINAEEVTGFRTALGAMILYVHRSKTSNLVVFGAGKQALWHLRLALALRGDEIETITLINRSPERLAQLHAQIKDENASKWKAKVDFRSVDPQKEQEKVEQALNDADVVFCTTPSTEIVVAASSLRKNDKPRYLSAIGSWQPEMIELDPELLQDFAQKSAAEGMVVVDDVDSCMEDTGELIKSGLTSSQVSEVGAVTYALANKSEGSDDLRQCLRNGHLIYKSAGVGLMDFAAGQAIIALAKEKNVGITIPDF